MLLGSSYVTSFWPFFILYSGGFGLCNGISYGIPIYNSWKHFPNNKGLVTGIVLCGFGLGSFVFGMISTRVLNPDSINSVNGKFPDDIVQRVPQTLRVLVSIWACFLVIGILMLFPEPPNNSLSEKIIKSQVVIPDEHKS